VTPEDEAKARVRLERGVRAQAILDDDITREAIEALKKRAYESFKSADPGDTQALAIAKMRFEVTEDWVNHFASLMQKGKQADAALAKWHALPARRKRTA